MSEPELWYNPASTTRELANRERAGDVHPSVLGVAIIVVALLVAVLLLAR